MYPRALCLSLLLFATACGTPLAQVLPSNSPSTAPSPKTSGLPTPSPAPSAQPISKVSLSVLPDFDSLPANERETLLGKDLAITLTSERYDGPFPEPVAVPNLDQPVVVPSSRPYPKPVFEQTQTFKFGETVVFKSVPANESYRVSFNQPTRIQPADPSQCEPSGGQVSAVGYETLQVLNADLSFKLPIKSSGPFVDLIACERTRVTGQVVDANGMPLAGAKVTLEAVQKPSYFAKVLNTETDQNGNYTFFQVFSGLLLKIEASKSGYTSESKTEVPSSNKQGDPNVNRYTFVLKAL